jgi:hypothetical protein
LHRNKNRRFKAKSRIDFIANFYFQNITILDSISPFFLSIDNCRIFQASQRLPYKLYEKVVKAKTRKAVFGYQKNLQQEIEIVTRQMPSRKQK